MQDWPSRGVNQGFKETNLTSSEDSSTGIKPEVSPFRQFISKFEEILVAIFLGAVLISAFWQSLFRDPLLAWLRDILESN